MAVNTFPVYLTVNLARSLCTPLALPCKCSVAPAAAAAAPSFLPAQVGNLKLLNLYGEH